MSAERKLVRRIVFVARRMTGESLRASRAIKQIDGVILFGICQRVAGAASNPDALDTLSHLFDGLIQIESIDDAQQLGAAVDKLSGERGSVDQVVTATETLLEPVAHVNEGLGLPGLSHRAVRRTLDKSCLKAVFKQNGIPCARDRIITSAGDAKYFAEQVGFPVVLKPTAGSGALATARVRDANQLHLALQLMCPEPSNPVLAEEFLSGEELCFDTITIASEPRFFSICRYSPAILEAVEDPSIQWTCLMPRDISGPRYRDFIDRGLRAVRALSVGDAMTHMEGFNDPQRGPCFIDATLRPAGARIGPMLGLAYDIDPYFAWARVALDGSFDGPWDRKYAVGTVFLRGEGSGSIQQVHGLESLSRHLGDMVVDSRLPKPGAPKSSTYTGDGYVTVRHPQTEAVEAALEWIIHTVRVTYSHHEIRGPRHEMLTAQWKERFRDSDRQLTRPVWDDDIAQAAAPPLRRQRE